VPPAGFGCAEVVPPGGLVPPVEVAPVVSVVAVVDVVLDGTSPAGTLGDPTWPRSESTKAWRW
jgi:hypothetical protein